MTVVHPEDLPQASTKERKKKCKDSNQSDSQISDNSHGKLSKSALKFPSPDHNDLVSSSKENTSLKETEEKRVASTTSLELSHVRRHSTLNKQTWRALKYMGKAVSVLNTHARENEINIYHDPHKGNARYMIHPNSQFRRVWDVITAICVLYVCTMVPLIVGFDFVVWDDYFSITAINAFIDVWFVIDMVITLRTGIYSNGEVIMNTKIVAHKYFTTWFIIDLISNFPIAWFIAAYSSKERKAIKMVKMQKIPKLLRFGRLLKYLKEYAKFYNLALSFIGLIMGLHLFACLWSNVFHKCWDELDRNICNDEEIGVMYVQSIHTVMLMFLGITENSSFAPISNYLENPSLVGSSTAYLMSVALYLLGMVFSSFFFGNILALIMSWDQLSSQFRNRMDIISAEMRYYELPDELQHRVRRNYDYLWINQRAYSDMMLLNQPGISKTLRTTIALHLYKDLVRTVPFFAGSDVRFLGKVCLALETAVYLPGDTIIYYDDIGKEMFIVRKGLVEILLEEQRTDTFTEDNTEKRIFLRDGNFFGETALVIDVRRTNTVKAINICDLNVLSKSAFNEIVAEYPEFGERMKRTVIKRQLDNMNIQSPTEKIKVQNQLNMVVDKSLRARRTSVSLRSIYRAKKLGDKLKEIAEHAARTTEAAERRLTRKLSRAPNSPARNMDNSSHRDEALLSYATPEEKHRKKLSLSTNQAVSNRSHTVTPQHSNNSGSRHTNISETGIVNVQVSKDGDRILLPENPTLLTEDDASIKKTSQIDAVSRKLSKAELTMDLIPQALLEITTMVNQIKKTTDKLNRRFYDDDYSSSDIDEFDSGSDDEMQSYNFNGALPPVEPLIEEEEEELARWRSLSLSTTSSQP